MTFELVCNGAPSRTFFDTREAATAALADEVAHPKNVRVGRVVAPLVWTVREVDDAYAASFAANGG